MKESENRLIIAGPCAAESRDSVVNCAKEIRPLVQGFRASLWKPRTVPGFEGVGSKGIPWLVDVVQTGLITATEVIVPGHVDELIENLVAKCDSSARFIFWLGSRNQNHLVQREIASLIKDNSQISLMIKNQPWEEERHWLGIIDHILSSGFPSNRLLLCHRGFAPSGRDNPHNFRNLPNWEMAKRIKERSGLPMIIDPSHIGGTKENVMTIVNEASGLGFDGLLVEVHQNPQQALSDSSQQISTSDLPKLLKLFESKP